MSQVSGITKLPPGYRVLNDGPGREVLFKEDWDEAEVYPTIQAAADRAWYLEGVTP
jgi:hypothetical protein